jgi:hypothetical protein
MDVNESLSLAAGVYDPGRLVTRDREFSGAFVSQELPTVQAWRDLAPFLVLPGVCAVSFYCETPDVPDRVHMVFADLDPAANRGFTRCQLSLHGGVWLTDSAGTVTPRVACRVCGSPWCAEGDTGYGTTNDCPDCGDSSYSDRGD